MTLDCNSTAELFQTLLGSGKVITGDRLSLRNPGYCPEAYAGGILLTPETTQEVSGICGIANEHGIALVPHGGLTGLVEATSTGNGEAAVSFERMNRILRLDPLQGVATVEAGVRLQELVEAAAACGLQPGVDLPSRGTCTIGGMTGTNAGGIQAIRYGMMRDNILGLTAVLASGEILDLGNTLFKNNAGYDLKQMFIGSEGTLGLITEVTVKLHPRPLQTETAFLGCISAEAFPDLVQMARARFGNRLLSFEGMWPSYVDVVGSQPGMGPRPLAEKHPAYAIIETGIWEEYGNEGSTMEAYLEEVFEAGLVADAVVSQSESQRAALWRIREDSDAIDTRHEKTLTYDVGLELADIPRYVEVLDQAVAQKFPDLETYYFGHLGDGNLHVMLGGTRSILTGRTELDSIVYGILGDFKHTTVSAEHGIGLEKRPYLRHSRSPVACSAMRNLKAAFDPKGILNPGKIF